VMSDEVGDIRHVPMRPLANLGEPSAQATRGVPKDQEAPYYSLGAGGRRLFSPRELIGL
jgi:hypothetical protein